MKKTVLKLSSILQGFVITTVLTIIYTTNISTTEARSCGTNDEGYCLNSRIIPRMECRDSDSIEHYGECGQNNLCCRPYGNVGESCGVINGSRRDKAGICENGSSTCPGEQERINSGFGCVSGTICCTVPTDTTSNSIWDHISRNQNQRQTADDSSSQSLNIGTSSSNPLPTTTTTPITSGSCPGGTVFCGPGIAAGADMAEESLDSGISKDRDLRSLIISWTTYLYPIAAILAVVAIIYAGFLYIIAFGDDGKTEEAKKIILWVVSGIILILGAFAIVNSLITGIFN